MDRLRRDVRIALRGFRRTPAFTAAVVAILALGIGMASTMAAVTDAVLRRPLPVEAPERVVALWPTRDGVEISLLPDDLERLRRDSRTMRAIAGFVHWGAFPYAITDGDRPLVLHQSRVTGNFFDVLGTRPALGRLLRPEDDVAGAPPVIVLGTPKRGSAFPRFGFLASRAADARLSPCRQPKTFRTSQIASPSSPVPRADSAAPPRHACTSAAHPSRSTFAIGRGPRKWRSR